MNKLVTEEEELKVIVKVWAIPRGTWYMEAHPNESPFKLELKTNRVWEDGAVSLYEKEVSVTVPAGIDMREKAIDTLQDEIIRVNKDAAERSTSLQKQIDGLRLIEHKPIVIEV